MEIKTMNEKVFSFGDDNSLAGVITTPEGAVQSPAVIILNAGLIHRVGPHRLNVDIARKLAENGFLAVRVDLYGVGDSIATMNNKSFRERAVDDIRETMNFLSSSYGIEEFVLIGLCAGADNAHPVAVEDKRVTGVVFLDAYGYPTLKFKALHKSGSRDRKVRPA